MVTAKNAHLAKQLTLRELYALEQQPLTLLRGDQSAKITKSMAQKVIVFLAQMVKLHRTVFALEIQQLIIQTAITIQLPQTTMATQLQLTTMAIQLPPKTSSATPNIPILKMESWTCQNAV